MNEQSSQQILLINNLHSICVYNPTKHLQNEFLFCCLNSESLCQSNLNNATHMPMPVRVRVCLCLRVRSRALELANCGVVGSLSQVRGYGGQRGAVSTERRRVFDGQAAYGAPELKWERPFEGPRTALAWGFSVIPRLTAEHAPALCAPVRVRAYRRACCDVYARARRHGHAKASLMRCLVRVRAVSHDAQHACGYLTPSTARCRNAVMGSHFKHRLHRLTSPSPTVPPR